MIGEDDVLKIAGLARLSVAESEKTRLTENLNSILGYVEQLKSVDVSAVEPMSHVHGIFNVFREDRVVESQSRDEIFANVPDRSGRFIRVPIIIDQ